MVKFTRNSKGFRQVLNSQAVESVVSDAAQRMVAEADGYGQPALSKKYGYKVGHTDRARAIVFTDSPHAMRSNLKHNTLVKVMGEVRL